jgi:hypothetical protein
MYVNHTPGGNMQTFLPYEDFEQSARVLDNRRLGKQITEVDQILDRLESPSMPHAWRNHPTVKMWVGHAGTLVDYGIEMYAEWQDRLSKGERGGVMEHKSGEHILDQHLTYWDGCQYRNPPWLGDPAFHKAHRGALLWKGLMDKTYGRLKEKLPQGTTAAQWLRDHGYNKKHRWTEVDYNRACRYIGTTVTLGMTYYGLVFADWDSMLVADDSGSLPYVWPVS